jgi:hypothetical protein
MKGNPVQTKKHYQPALLCRSAALNRSTTASVKVADDDVFSPLAPQSRLSALIAWSQVRAKRGVAWASGTFSVKICYEQHATDIFSFSCNKSRVALNPCTIEH